MTYFLKCCSLDCAVSYVSLLRNNAQAETVCSSVQGEIGSFGNSGKLSKFMAQTTGITESAVLQT